MAVLRRPPLVVTAVIVLTASAMLGVRGATMAVDGEAGLTLAFPFVTGPIAAVILGFLDVLLEHRDDNRTVLHGEHGR